MRRWKVALVLSVLSITAGMASSLFCAGAAQSALEARAERIFEFDRRNANKLPSHRIRALSVALAFHDHEGADFIMSDLETRLRSLQ